MKIKVEKPTPADVAAFAACATWSKEPSVFDWQYDSTETCYLLEGAVRVTTADGEIAEFGAGEHGDVSCRIEVHLGSPCPGAQALSLRLIG